MTNKQLIQIVTAILLIAIAAWGYRYFFGYNETVQWIIDIGFAASFVLALYLLISSGTITLTIYWEIGVGGVILFCAGVVMFIMRASYAHEVLVAGLAITAVTYLVRFIAKRLKNHLDVLKLLWVLSFALITALIFLHIIARKYFIIPKTLFWIAFYDFVYLELKRNPPSGRAEKQKA